MESETTSSKPKTASRGRTKAGSASPEKQKFSQQERIDALLHTYMGKRIRSRLANSEYYQITGGGMCSPAHTAFELRRELVLAINACLEKAIIEGNAMVPSKVASSMPRKLPYPLPKFILVFASADEVEYGYFDSGEVCEELCVRTGRKCPHRAAEIRNGMRKLASEANKSIGGACLLVFVTNAFDGEACTHWEANLLEIDAKRLSQAPRLSAGTSGDGIHYSGRTLKDRRLTFNCINAVLHDGQPSLTEEGNLQTPAVQVESAQLPETHVRYQNPNTGTHKLLNRECSAVDLNPAKPADDDAIVPEPVKAQECSDGGNGLSDADAAGEQPQPLTQQMARMRRLAETMVEAKKVADAQLEQLKAEHAAEINSLQKKHEGYIAEQSAMYERMNVEAERVLAERTAERDAAIAEKGVHAVSADEERQKAEKMEDEVKKLTKNLSAARSSQSHSAKTYNSTLQSLRNELDLKSNEISELKEGMQAAEARAKGFKDIIDKADKFMQENGAAKDEMEAHLRDVKEEYEVRLGALSGQVTQANQRLDEATRRANSASKHMKELEAELEQERETHAKNQKIAAEALETANERGSKRHAVVQSQRKEIDQLKASLAALKSQHRTTGTTTERMDSSTQCWCLKCTTYTEQKEKEEKAHEEKEKEVAESSATATAATQDDAEASSDAATGSVEQEQTQPALQPTAAPFQLPMPMPMPVPMPMMNGNSVFDVISASQAAQHQLTQLTHRLASQLPDYGRALFFQNESQQFGMNHQDAYQPMVYNSQPQQQSPQFQAPQGHVSPVTVPHAHINGSFRRGNRFR